MNATLRRRLERAVRVRDFIRAHRTDGAGEATALTRLEELIQRADVLAAQQRSGVVAARAATMRREELRHALQSKLLIYLAAVGAVAAKGNTELAPQFQLPPAGASNQAFLTAARGMLEKATAQKDLLVSRGMSAQLVDDLTAALTKFEQTLEATRAGRRDHVGASADLESVLSEITEQVRLLDGLVRYRFSDNAELMGAWASARNVLGPFKTRTEPPADEGQAPEGTPLSSPILLPQRVEPVILSAVGAKDLLFSALLDPIPRCKAYLVLNLRPRGSPMTANSTGKSPWGGWLLHAAVGLGLTAVLAGLDAPRVALLVAVLATGIAHEIGDGDFRRAKGGPWNGVLDVLAFLPAPLVYLVAHAR